MKLSKLRVPELRKELKARGLDEKGNRPVLMKRLREALLREQRETDQNNQVDKQTQDEQLASTAENHAESKAQQPARMERSPAECKSKSTSEREREPETGSGDPDFSRTYKAIGDGRNEISANQETEIHSSPVRGQYSSEKLENARADRDSAYAHSVASVKEPSLTQSEAIGKDTVSSSMSPEAQKSKVNSLEKDDMGGATELQNKNGSPSKDKLVEPKSDTNVKSADDAASLERIRRRRERFGIVIKEEESRDPTDEQAVLRRRARFGTVATENKPSTKALKASKQQHDQAALRRRAEKFGVGIANKRGPIDAGLSKDEIEKRLKRQKRFQSVS